MLFRSKQHAWTWPALTADYPKAPLESAPPYLILSARFYVPIESVLQSPELLKDTSFWSETGVPDKKALTFYDDILNGKSTQYSYTLKAEFTANPILEFNGDTLRIYEKCDNAKLQESHPTN